MPLAAAILLGVVGLAGGVLFLGGAEASAAAETSAAAKANAELEWKYRHAGGDAERAAVESAVDRAILEMNPLVRGIARRRLLEANPIIEKLGFSLGGDPLRASFIDGRMVESPASGAPVDWVDPFGDTVKVSQRWSDHELVQHMFDDHGSRTNVYRFTADGQRMTMSVTIESPRLPEPIRYRLSYRKHGEA